MSELSYFIAHTLEINWAIVGSLWLCMAAVLISILRDLLRSCRPGAERAEFRRKVVTALIITAVALATRVILPATLMHENSHGYLYFTDVACAQPVRDVYGFGYFALHYPFYRIFGASFETLFAVQIALSSLSTLLVFALLQRLDWPRESAFGAALALAFCPLAARFGASEDMLVPAIFFTLLSTERTLAFAAGGSRLAAAGAAAALLTAIQTRPEMYLFAPLFVTTLVLSNSTARRALLAANRRRVLLAAFAGLALLGALPLHNLLWRMLHNQIPAAELLSFDWPQTLRLLLNLDLKAPFIGNAALNPTFTPLPLIALGAGGMIMLLAAPPPGGRAVPLLWLAALLLWINVQVSEYSAARLQQWSLVIWCTAAGHAAGLALRGLAAMRRGGYALRLLAVSAFAAALLAGFAQSTDFLRADYNQRREFDFLQQAMPKLPQNAQLFGISSDGIVNSFFPQCHRTLEENGVAFKQIRKGESVAEGSDIFYLGLPCYSFASAEEAATGVLRPQCREILQHCSEVLEGLSASFASRPFDYLFQPAENIRPGFYRCR